MHFVGGVRHSKVLVQMCEEEWCHYREAGLHYENTCTLSCLQLFELWPIILPVYTVTSLKIAYFLLMLNLSVDFGPVKGSVRALHGNLDVS